VNLPASAQEIADVIGREQALFLIGQLPRIYSPDTRYKAAQKSTVVMYVPKVLQPTDKLVRILGWVDASKLARAFSGMLIHPASCTEIYRPFRDRNIIRLVNEGVPRLMVAEWFGISERMVRTILSEIPPHERRAANEQNCSIPTPKRRANDKPAKRSTKSA
jgi:hypothetical protein